MLIDNLCDVYDLFNLEELNDIWMGRKKLDGKKGKKKGAAAAAAPSSPTKGGDKKGGKVKRPKKPIKRRGMEKVTQSWVLTFLKEFIVKNENLIHLDLTETGLDSDGVLEIASLLKSTLEDKNHKP